MIAPPPADPHDVDLSPEVVDLRIRELADLWDFWMVSSSTAAMGNSRVLESSTFRLPASAPFLATLAEHAA